MYAVLGEILFETLTSPNAFESTRTFDYAEHKVVEDRPRLQWLANALEKLTLELVFHVNFTNPQTQLNLLRAAAEDHQARALVFGNGIHRGYFVITELTETHRHCAEDGSLIYASARVTLHEWALGAEADASAPPRPQAPPPGIIVSSATNTPAGFDPNAPVSARNPASNSVLLQLGVTPFQSYRAPSYNAPGVSPIVQNPGAPAPPNTTILPGDVAPAQIVGSQ